MAPIEHLSDLNDTQELATEISYDEAETPRETPRGAQPIAEDAEEKGLSKEALAKSTENYFVESAKDEIY